MADQPEGIEVTVNVPAQEPETPVTPVPVVQLPASGASEALAVQVGALGANVETMAATLAEVVSKLESVERTADDAFRRTMEIPEPMQEPEAITEIPVTTEASPASESAGVPASRRSWWMELLV